LDFAAYLDKYYQGRIPDVILILLGCNDIAHASMDDFSSWMEESRIKRRQLLEHIRLVAPNSIIGLVTLPPANARHKAYLDNYHGVVVHQQYAYNQLTYVKQLMLDYQDDPGCSIVPIYPGIDPVADYPEDNSIHPNEQGYFNFALAIEAWLKAMF
jgi:lysophospholipase L1-like esterase